MVLVTSEVRQPVLRSLSCFCSPSMTAIERCRVSILLNGTFASYCGNNLASLSNVWFRRSRRSFSQSLFFLCRFKKLYFYSYLKCLDSTYAFFGIIEQHLVSAWLDQQKYVFLPENMTSFKIFFFDN